MNRKWEMLPRLPSKIPFMIDHMGQTCKLSQPKPPHMYNKDNTDAHYVVSRFPHPRT